MGKNVISRPIFQGSWILIDFMVWVPFKHDVGKSAEKYHWYRKNMYLLITPWIKHLCRLVIFTECYAECYACSTILRTCTRNNPISRVEFERFCRWKKFVLPRSYEGSRTSVGTPNPQNRNNNLWSNKGRAKTNGFLWKRLCCERNVDKELTTTRKPFSRRPTARLPIDVWAHHNELFKPVHLEPSPLP